MGKLQIEDRKQQEEIGEDPKKEESPLALPPPQQVQGESSQDLPNDWKFVINHPQDQIIGNPSSGVHWGGSSCKRHSSGQMVPFLALEIQHIVNSLTGAAQIHPSIRFHFNSLTDATCNGLSFSPSLNHSR
ncbi:hypothetical protein CK203_088523 [Vitis vinifera]|uniref:Uncharacterized protein n=1 Tax=Vitis vinifera TaxID=29760 RepID=A0A438F046_VITVI|nr:hypothetical protein CK203_088523 [Vitis vinifera]